MDAQRVMLGGVESCGRYSAEWLVARRSTVLVGLVKGICRGLLCTCWRAMRRLAHKGGRIGLAASCSGGLLS